MAGEAVLSVFMQVLFEKLATTALNEFSSLRGVKKELQNLSGMLSTIQIFIEDAEMKQLRDKLVRNWLAKLKDVAYDMDELLEEYKTEALRSKLEGQVQKNWKKQVSDYFSCSCLYKCSSRCKIAHKLKAIGVRLDRIARDRNVLGLQVLGNTNRIEFMKRPQTSSLVDDSSVFGREEDREKIVNVLLTQNHSNRSKLCILPIVGMGGLGKTTLTQLVYNDNRVKAHFQLRMWVYVSENFDESKLTKEILESAANGNSAVTTNMNLLQEELSDKLRGKRFLLVLDDVWNEDHDKWYTFIQPLLAGEIGSKIIVTTQNGNVGRVMGGLPPYHLKQLSDYDCWNLFRSYAFVDVKSSELHPNLMEIGKEIVKKLKGLPLAAKALGSLLYSKLDEDDWKNILRSEIWELPFENNNILPALRLSYKHLPPHLKQCFAFCSVFHKDYIFEKENLVQIWMALGFVRPQGRKRMEDVGSSYFDDLLGRSFFQSHKGNYVMHDAIHDLAQSISTGECLRLEDDEGSSGPIKARHVSFSCDDSVSTSLEPFYEFEKIRTLLLLRGQKSRIRPLPDDLFLQLRCLRVLDLNRRRITELPSSIGNLIQLRYLSLSGTRIKTLPSTISRLYNLQTLKLKDCILLTQVPENVTNLINLRHLNTDAGIISAIAGIGRLTCLQQIDEFVVRRQRGYTIVELKDMMEIRGSLCIQNLENVDSAEEAREARLRDKEYINVLDLVWSNDRHISLDDECCDEEVLGGLQPHPELKELTIKGYAGAKFPNWLGSPTFGYLQKIHLSNFRKCRSLPPLGQLPHLRYLDIVGLYGVSIINREFSGNGEIEFPSLTELVLEDMPDLEEWFCAEDNELLPCLTHLEIINCPKLSMFPHLPPRLTRLRISEVGLTALPEVRIPNNSALSSLHINECPKLRSLQQGLLGQQLRALEELMITDCEELVFLPVNYFRPFISLKILQICNCPQIAPMAQMEGMLPSSLEDLRVSSSTIINQLLSQFNNLHCLAHLEINDCPDFYCFPEELPASLKYLGITDCMSLQNLPARMQELPSLETLIINNCPGIPSLPDNGVPVALQRVYIDKCPLLTERMRKNSGRDWMKLDHVPDVEIDGEQFIRRNGNVTFG